MGQGGSPVPFCHVCREFNIIFGNTTIATASMLSNISVSTCHACMCAICMHACSCQVGSWFITAGHWTYPRGNLVAAGYTLHVWQSGVFITLDIPSEESGICWIYSVWESGVLNMLDIPSEESDTYWIILCWNLMYCSLLST